MLEFFCVLRHFPFVPQKYLHLEAASGFFVILNLVISVPHAMKCTALEFLIQNMKLNCVPLIKIWC